MDRRSFLAGSGAGLAGSLGAAAPAAAAPRIRHYPVLGRTGLRVSDVSFGGSSLTDPELVRHAFERGVTYFDTAESYWWGRSEEAVHGLGQPEPVIDIGMTPPGEKNQAS